MEGYGPETYGERWAEVYDDRFDDRFGSAGTTQATVAFLADLANGGRVLELGVGTGRIAVPLAQRGLEVHGIDASAAMLRKLRERPGGERVAATLGDFADVDVGGRFDLVFVVFNTFFSLTSQEQQVRCFEQVARNLTDGGVFVVEAFVPDVARFDGGQCVRANGVEAGSVDLEVSRHDAAAQTVQSQHVVITSEGFRMLPVHIRYAWPSELDLMARLAGLALRERWGGWDRVPFTATSGSHVSIYAQSPSRQRPQPPRLA